MVEKEQYLNVGGIDVDDKVLQGIVEFKEGDGIEITSVNTDDERSVTHRAKDFVRTPVTGDYTALDADDTLFVNSSADVDITLQAVTARTRNRSIEIKRIDTTSNKIEIFPDGDDLIENDSSLVLSAGGNPSARLTPDGVSNWWIT